MNLRIAPVLILLLKSFVNLVFAQTPNENILKYQAYRDRLLNDFMVSSSGNEPGTNLPASYRNVYTGVMRWGDATINLSSYMAVLATEFRLRKINHLPVDQTLVELNNAVSAIERLDKHANIFFGDRDALPVTGGFFMRDDVPATFTKDWAWKNPSFADYPRVMSDYTEPEIRLNEMSQDQVWHLIIGLALISRLVDDTTGYTNPFFPSLPRYTLSQRAMIISFQIIKALQHKKCLHFFRKGGPCFKVWSLRNPVTNKTVKRGADPGFLKYGFAEAGDFITGNNFGSLHWGTSRQAKIWFRLAGFLQLMQQFSPKGNIDYLFHVGSMATVGNIWSTRDLLRLYNRHHTFFFVSHPHYEHFALISCLLHNDCPPVLYREKEKYEKLLDLAPADGPLNFGVAATEGYAYEWSSINRFVWPDRRGNGMPGWLYGEYNGLDYMLLFNLYHLVFNPDGILSAK